MQAWSSLRYRARRTHHAPRDWAISAAERLDDRLDALFEQVAPTLDFVQRRDQQTVSWQYADPRGGRHSIRLAEQAGTRLGYAVLRRSAGEGYGMDLLALSGRVDVAASLFDAASKELADCAATNCWMTPGHPYEGVTRARGYIDLHGETGMPVRQVTVEPHVLDPVLAGGSTVHVMLGDSDWL
jgi:hypothetical protein